jgi:putative tryptophan/tyrosine transport system substrate-binding protein
MKRRDFITLLGGAAAASSVCWPLGARAQQPPQMLRVGVVSGQTRSGPIFVAFEQRMAELGYQAGKNFTLEFVRAASIEEFESGYRELAARKVDIILAGGPEITLKSALAVAGRLPIVMIAINYDPFAHGYVTSLARPSGNVTGIFFQQIELSMKRVQLVMDALPNMRGATVFWDAASADLWRGTQEAAKQLGLRLAGIDLRDPPYDYDRALAQSPPDHRGGLIALASPFLFVDRERLADFALRNRMASMFASREYVDAGGLLSYGPSITGLYRRAAEYVDRIAKGAKPSDLPIEQPTRFELIINVKTAKAIGVDVPVHLQQLADEVIE